MLWSYLILCWSIDRTCWSHVDLMSINRCAVGIIIVWNLRYLSEYCEIQNGFFPADGQNKIPPSTMSKQYARGGHAFVGADSSLPESDTPMVPPRTDYFKASTMVESKKKMTREQRCSFWIQQFDRYISMKTWDKIQHRYVWTISPPRQHTNRYMTPNSLRDSDQTVCESFVTIR